MYKRFLKISFLILLALVSSGCTPFFMSNNNPKTIQENTTIPLQEQTKTQNSNKIKGFDSITPGVIQDLCFKGDNIIILRKDPVEVESPTENGRINNLAFYNLKEEKIQNVTSSSLDILLSQFDANEKGVYYLETKEESPSELYWFDISNNAKMKISSFDHQVSSDFYVKSNNEVYYGTNNGKIIRACKNNILTTIDIGSESSIQQIYYSEDKNLLLFSALKEDIVNLYSITSDGQNLTKIEQNINGHFEISKKEDKLLYSTSIPDSNKTILWLYHLKDKQNIKLLEGYPQKSIISPKGDKVAYLDTSDSNSDLQNIWILNLKTNEKEQIASNLKIASRLFWHLKNNKLFFSIYESKDNQLQSMVYSLDFEN